MTRKQFLIGALTLGGAGTWFTTGAGAPVRLDEALTGNLCSLQSPKALYKVFSAKFSFDPEILSMAGQDRFYRIYQRKLEPVVDARFPKAKEYREYVVRAFLAVSRFFESSVRRAGGQREALLPAEVEWFILTGESEKFEPLWKDNYTHADLLDLGRMIARAQFEVQGPEDQNALEDRLIPELKKALEPLASAEKHLSEQGRSYYRKKLLQFMAEFI